MALISFLFLLSFFPFFFLKSILTRTLVAFREPTSFSELLTFLQRLNSIKVLSSGDDWDIIPANINIGSKREIVGGCLA